MNIRYIENTGIIDLYDEEDKGMYKHLIIKDCDNTNNAELKEMAETHNVDYISEVKNKRIEFLHVSKIKYKQDIKEQGLFNIEVDYVPDLGNGIYVIEKDNTIALDNLKTYVSELDYSNILLVKGFYNGEYTECIYGDLHEGYIVINKNILNITNITEISIDDFLLKY